MEKIKCPKCNHEFSVDEFFQHENEERIQKEIEEATAASKERMAKQMAKQLVAREKEIEKQLKEDQKETAKENEDLTKKLEALQKATDVSEDKMAKQMAKQLTIAVAAKDKEIDSIEEKMAKQLVAREKEIEKQLKTKEELASAQREKEILEIQNKHSLEKQQLILQAEEKQNQIKRKLDEATSRISPSGQLRGEIGENYVKEKLEHYFKDDILREIPRGQEGVDLVLDVNAKKGKKIASIYIEVKNTNTYLKSWVKKLRKNMQDDGIECGVLITKTFPVEHKKKTQFFPAGTKEIIVCSLDEIHFFVPIALLRNKLIEMKTMVNIDKASRSEIPQKIFEYITGPQFSNIVKNIFTTLAEKRQKNTIRKQTFNRIMKEDEAFINDVEMALIEALGTIKQLSPKSNIGLPEDEETAAEEWMANEEKMAKQLAKQLADYDKYNRYKKKEIEKKIKKRLPKKMKI